MGPPERSGDWTDEGVEGVHRFLSRLWRLGEELEGSNAAIPDGGDFSRVDLSESIEADAAKVLMKSHWAIQKATDDFNRDFQFNTVIAAVMELVNEIYRNKDSLLDDTKAYDAGAVAFATATAASLIQPFAPHLAAEVYEKVTGERVWEVAWPQADPEMLRSETVTIVVQVGGKVRDRIEVAEGAPEEEILAVAKAAENVARHLEGMTIVKEIVVPGKLVNLVVKPG